MKTPMELIREKEQKGAVGYILLWALGIPASCFSSFSCLGVVHRTSKTYGQRTSRELSK